MWITYFSTPHTKLRGNMLTHSSYIFVWETRSLTNNIVISVAPQNQDTCLILPHIQTERITYVKELYRVIMAPAATKCLLLRYGHCQKYLTSLKKAFLKIFRFPHSRCCPRGSEHKMKQHTLKILTLLTHCPVTYRLKNTCRFVFRLACTQHNYTTSKTIANKHATVNLKLEQQSFKN